MFELETEVCREYFNQQYKFMYKTKSLPYFSIVFIPCIKNRLKFNGMRAVSQTTGNKKNVLMKIKQIFLLINLIRTINCRHFLW